MRRILYKMVSRDILFLSLIEKCTYVGDKCAAILNTLYDKFCHSMGLCENKLSRKAGHIMPKGKKRTQSGHKYENGSIAVHLTQAFVSSLLLSFHMEIDCHLFSRPRLPRNQIKLMCSACVYNIDWPKADNQLHQTHYL
jgi:hypothetical protein